MLKNIKTELAGFSMKNAATVLVSLAFLASCAQTPTQNVPKVRSTAADTSIPIDLEVELDPTYAERLTNLRAPNARGSGEGLSS